MKNLFISIGLIFLAISERLWFDFGPNVELITTVSVLATVFLGKKYGLGVALISLAISDMILGNSLIMIFTWSAFGMIAAAANFVRRSSLRAGIYGLGVSLFFYFWTNLGVWLIGGLYPLTFSGLIDSYMMGLPFLRVHAVSNLLLLTGSFTAIKWFGQLRWNSETVPQL